MRTIAVTGGKGGAGKTSLSTSLAIALAQKGFRTVLFDADLGLANVDVVLGLRSEYSLQHVVSDEKTLREVLHPGPAGLQVATGASGVASLASAGPKKLKKFFGQIFAIEDETDYLIFDTGSGLDRRVMAFLSASDDVVVVVTPDAASLTDGYATIKALFRAEKSATVNVVVNMADSAEEARRTFNALSKTVKKFLGQDIGYLGIVHRDAVAAHCIRNRKPFMVDEPKCPAAVDIRKLSNQIVKWGDAPVRQFSNRMLSREKAA